MSKQEGTNMQQQPYTDNPPAYGFQAPPGSQPVYPQQSPYPQQQQVPYPQQQQPQVILVTEQQPTRTVIVTRTQMAGLGPESLSTKCPSCQMQIHTKLQQENSSRTHLTALLLCLFGCWCCVPIPYCMDSCKNTNHYCPNCNSFLGTYQA